MRKVISQSFFVFVLAASCKAQIVSPVVEWRKQDGGNGHFYAIAFAQNLVRSSEAELIANSMGAHLLTGCGDEFAFAVSATGGLNQQYYIHGDGPYIGLIRPNFGPWRWVDNTQCTFDYWNTAWGQPDNNRDIVTILVNYNGIAMKVHDAEDIPHSRYFIIEWDADCNSDGLVDYGQILSGSMIDANRNNIPDGPVITRQPRDQSVSFGSNVSFSVEVQQQNSCSQPLVYQWQRRNPAVSDQYAENAWINLQDDATYSNTDRASMTIRNPGPSIATGFRCKISGGCACESNASSSIHSHTVNFTISCPSDFNADGGIDFQDVELFFLHWENGC